MVVGVYRSLLAAGMAAGHPEMVLFYALLGSWSVLFVTAIPLALSVLYYSSELPMLLTLPVKPRSIVGAKVVLLYLYCLPVNLVLFVPALWLYVGATGLPGAVIVSGVIALFAGPMLPLSIAILFGLGLMKIVNLSRYRVALEAAGMTLGIVLVIGLQVMLSRVTIATLAGGSSPLTGFSDLYTGMQRALPPLAWAASGFSAGSGPLPVTLTLLVTAAPLALVLVLAPVNFLHDVTERREAGGEKKHAGMADSALLARRSAPRGIVRSLVAREWFILSSNSTYIFEAIGELLILPLLLGVYSLIIPRQYLVPAMKFITAMPALSLAVMGILVLMTSLTTVSSTSISREGRRMALSLSIPVAGRTQVKAKLVLHLLFFSTAYVADLAIVWVLFHYPLISLLFMLPGGIALQVAAFAAGISFDLKRPLLKWTHPQQAMKSNMNAGMGIASSAGIVAVIAAPCALLALRGISTFLIGCGAAVAGIVIAAVLLQRLLAFADRQYSGGMELEG
jgi:ABC-2 type transport system permease protein